MHPANPLNQVAIIQNTTSRDRSMDGGLTRRSSFIGRLRDELLNETLFRLLRRPAPTVHRRVKEKASGMTEA